MNKNNDMSLQPFKKRRMIYDNDDFYYSNGNENQLIKINLLIDLLKEALDSNNLKLLYNKDNKDNKDNIIINNNNINNINSIVNLKKNNEHLSYFILEKFNIKYPIQFKKINNFEEKIEFIIKNTGNIIYDYENLNKNIFSDLNIELFNYGINRIFNFEDLINFYLFSFSYFDNERIERNSYILNYIPKYIKFNNILTSNEYKINIHILNKFGIGTFGKVFDCELFSLNNIKKFGNYIIKIIDFDEDELYDLSQFFFEYLNQVILFEEFEKNKFYLIDSIAKIPQVLYIGKIISENKYFIVMEKIEKTLYEKCRNLLNNYLNNQNSNDLKKKTIIQNSVTLLNYIYQITNLIDNFNSLEHLKFVHNDLKLNNIMLNNNQCYLIDFGISNLKYKNYQIVNSFPTNIILNNNENIESNGLNYYIFNNNIDVFHLIYNIYYFLLKLLMII